MEMSTLERLKHLQGLVENYGSDLLIDVTINKLLNTKRRELAKSLAEVSREIEKLEQTYQMNTNDFWTRYNEGTLGDKVDYLKWASLIDMQGRLERQMRYLESDA
ncbi:MAG: hypothetical protein D9V47_01445 [Clostridia bacterium]|nr:MAG: hypothetical protein D9V47_01445 [Clostridia bacterium]